MEIVLQDGIMDCGICCLLSVIRHYGGNVSKEYLREITNTTKKGVSAYNLVNASKKIGFNSYAVNGSIEDIVASNLPIIAHVIINKNYMHFVVIYDIDHKKDKILIMDPAKGKVILSLNEFKLKTTNNYIILNPIKKIPKIEEKKVIKDTIINYLKKDKKYIFFLTILTFLYFFLNVISAFHFKYILDYSINYDIDKNLLLISSIVFIIYLLKEISFYLRNIILLKYQEIFDYVITIKTFKRIILLPYLYYKNRTTGEVISRLKDLNTIKLFLINLITSLITDIISIIIFVVILFNINYKLAYLSVIIFILLILVNLIFKPLIKDITIKYYKKEEKVNSYLIESLSSVDAIKGLHLEKRTVDKFSIKYKGYLNSFYKLTKLVSINNLIKNILDNSFYVFLYYFGSIFIIHKNLTLGELIIFQSIFNFYHISFNNIINLINEYPKYKVSLGRIEDMFTIKNENFINSSYYEKYNLKGKIIYKDLNYSFSSKKIFNNINFTINNKDKVFIYGSSGTGKSTLMKMLMRYIEVPYKTISIGGIDINHYHLDVIRNNITYVTNNEFIFNDTIKNNIVLNEKVDEKLFNKVCKLTHVNELGDLNNLIEENGFNYSGGERQRIILARSILKNSNIYIFDEALSQIDRELERDILLNIFKYLKDKTIIVISHRHENMDLYNRIVKIDKGKLYEEDI